MKLKDLELTGKTTDFENFFDVEKLDNGLYSFNLNETIFFDAKNGGYNVFIPDHDMFWPLVSYKVYGSTRLAWLLMKVNGVTAETIFDVVKAGT